MDDITGILTLTNDPLAIKHGDNQEKKRCNSKKNKGSR